MEDWKKDHISLNIVILVESTCCNVALITRLRASGVLTREDVEELESIRNREGETRQVNRFYSIFEKKSDRAYDILIKALYDSGQEAPAETLIKGFVTNGKQPGDFVKNHAYYKAICEQALENIED